ncbi:VIT domain-containing protein [Enhygromyxa salina]|uniref:Vault protein inter-alpha-trypsin n=1 Tax=Enhygromyxa salina TaxID=215803 RepID=A0A2S9XLG1_9BACT|nr:VIT domain-containing protein [Enhygromyxa salina]PRP93709.1 Vault protein inter-alpha-trypsin [Enhygromyxa salina]
MSEPNPESPAVLIPADSAALERRRPGWARRKASLITLASALALATAVTSSCKHEEIPEQAPALGATLELASGQVTLTTKAGETTLLSNTPLPIGAELHTSAGARALIRLGDGTRVFLRDDTKVTLADGLQLDSGQAWVEAPPLEQGQRASTHTLGAVNVSVSDGGASLTRTGDEVEIYVAEGLAIVTAPGGRTELDPGERATISGDGAPVVEPVKFWDDWTGGMGDHSASASSPWVGTGSVYAIDHMAGPGAQALPLAIQRQTVEVAIDEQVAETEVDQVFFNPAGSEVEGWYWFTVPEDAMIVSFALETNGALIEAEVVERRQATQIYEANIQRRVDPALLEWVDARTVRARIYPIPAAGTRRVVLRYQQLLSESEGKLRYRYPMAAPVGRDAATIEDFALALSLRGDTAKHYGLATRNDARVEGRDRDRVTMRRSGFTPRADFELELTRRRGAEASEDAPEPLRVNVFEPGNDQADYVMLRWTPDVEFAATAAPNGEVVVVVDTSAGSDPAEHQAKIAVAEALLRSLSPSDRFVLVGADLGAEVLYPEAGMAEATPEAISAALEHLTQRGAGGATDLGAIFEESLERVHGLEQPAIVYIGDGVATSGELDGDALAERLRRTLSGSRARLFTVAVGREVNDALLTKLARAGGGKSLRVAEAGEAVVRALELSGALKTPTLTDVSVDAGEGLDDLFVSSEGKLSRGEELTILARTHHELPEQITVSYRFAGETFTREYKLDREDSMVLSRLVPRLWARAYIDRLLTDTRGPEAVRGKILTLGLEYGLMTPFSSFLALEDESAYRRAGIERRGRQFPSLTADAELSRVAPVEHEPSSPTVLTMIGAAASAPFGCGVGPGPVNQDRGADDDRSESSRGGEAGNIGRSAQTRGPAPSAAPMADARLEPPADGIDPSVTAGEELERQDGQGQRWRSAGGLGVIELDAEAVELPSGAKDRASRLAAAGFAVPAPPAWVDEVTESELARGSMSGRARVTPSPVPHEQTLTCSDASTRGLVHRRVLWAMRLGRQTSMAGMLRVYEASLSACELPRWRDQHAFLDLLQGRARTEAEIQLLLGHFAADVDANTFLVQALLRRLIEPELIAAVNYAVYGGIESWWEIDRRLDTTDDPDERLRILDAALAYSPGDPDGERRMIAELVEQDRVDAAIARGLRLRDQGQLTPELSQLIGELLARRGRDEAAKRLFSELVEFAPHSLASRRLLGDIFLRHGWYADAYRQYELLMELAEGPEAAIRLARAAAGTGRTDEALRLLGRVQSGEGRPGEDDPRRYARLHIAGLIAGLLDSDLDLPKDKLTAELKSLGLFDGPATWELLLWEDLGVELTLAVAPSADGRPSPQADGVDAGGTGLFARQYSGGVPDLEIRHRGLVPDRDVSWRRITLRWDGEAFVVEQQTGTIAARVAKTKEEIVAEDDVVLDEEATD